MGIRWDLIDQGIATNPKGELPNSRHNCLSPIVARLISEQCVAVTWGTCAMAEVRWHKAV